MNIEQANRIPLSSILQKIGSMPVKQRGSELWYHSPFRKERTPSFHIHAAKNVWYDFGEAKGGNVVHFVCAYLQRKNEDDTIVDALRWLNNMEPSQTVVPFSKEDLKEYGKALQLRKASALRHPSFVSYLSSRGIPLALARKYLKEVCVRNLHTGKNFFALGFENENGGYELRNKVFKGCIAPKTISFIRGNTPLPADIHVFEGFMDFLSALTKQKDNRFEGDVIVLNSLICLPQAFPYIKDYSYKTLYTWLDNDATGKEANRILQGFAAKQGSLVFKPMNETYATHKDVNEWHMRKLGL
ncbi:MAG: toprim domain-containing protein [Williamsia sp.]|nr:toprim domain-containing protein [Williamsia sp.]